MTKLIIRRTYGVTQTLGIGIVTGQKDLFVLTLELPWKGNAQNISCIPKGTYKLEKIQRASNGDWVYWVKDVPGRTDILLHAGVYYYHFEGCVGVGLGYKDFNNDGMPDLTYSKKAMQKILALDLAEVVII